MVILSRDARHAYARGMVLADADPKRLRLLACEHAADDRDVCRRSHKLDTDAAGFVLGGADKLLPVDAVAEAAA
jgi:hypothetical protein